MIQILTFFIFKNKNVSIKEIILGLLGHFGAYSYSMYRLTLFLRKNNLCKNNLKRFYCGVCLTRFLNPTKSNI
jgi:hypothetical protein